LKIAHAASIPNTRRNRRQEIPRDCQTGLRCGIRVAIPLRCFLVFLALPFSARAESPRVATFSIVACDPKTGELGVAVQSRFLGVGAVVPWAKAGVSAIASQSFANTTYGPDGLKLLADGLAPEDVVTRLTEGDTRRAVRQLGQRLIEALQAG